MHYSVENDVIDLRGDKEEKELIGFSTRLYHDPHRFGPIPIPKRDYTQNYLPGKSANHRLMSNYHPILVISSRVKVGLDNYNANSALCK